MSSIDDLNAAVTNLATEQEALTTQGNLVVTTVADLVNEVASLNAAISAGDDTAIETAVGNINTITGNLTTTATDLATAATSDPGAGTEPVTPPSTGPAPVPGS